MSFSLSATQPLFPSLMPRQVDPLWHEVDVPKDEDAELTKLEKDHEAYMKSYTKRSLQPPIGTQSQEALDDDEMEEEDDDDDHDNEEDSDSRVDEDDVEMDMNFGQESPVNVLPPAT